MVRKGGNDAGKLRAALGSADAAATTKDRINRGLHGGLQVIRPIICAALLPLATAAGAQSGQPCTLDFVCDRLTSCGATPYEVTQYLDPIPGTE